MEALSHQSMKVLLKTNDLTIIAYASALLQGENITCFDMDVHMSVLEGSVGVLPRRLMVRDEDLGRAERVMSDNEIDLGDR